MLASAVAKGFNLLLPVHRWRHLLKPRPTARLTPDQVRDFHRDGFLVLRGFSTPAEVARIAARCRDLFARRAGWGRGDYFDMAGSEQHSDELAQPQIVNVWRHAPDLALTGFWSNAEEAAKALLGPFAALHVDHAILKPARRGPATPWHQDQAFSPAGERGETITVWMPLQDVDEENGCLRFVPGSHVGEILPHRRYMDDRRVHCVEAIGTPGQSAVSAPLRVGDVTIHHSRTLHGAPGNGTDSDRLSYAVLFSVDSGRVLVLDTYPWNLDVETPRSRRAAAPAQRSVEFGPRGPRDRDGAGCQD